MESGRLILSHHSGKVCNTRFLVGLWRNTSGRGFSYNKRTMILAMVPFSPFSAYEESISYVLSTG